LEEEAIEELEERFFSHGIRELPSTPPMKLFPPRVMWEEDPELGKEEDAGLGLYEALGLGWYEEQGLGDADLPIGSWRSAAVGLHPLR
jgi:hypothetical protein